MLQSRERVMVKVPDWLGYDEVAQRYERWMSDLDWSQIAEIDEGQARRGKLPHPERAYLGAFIVMVEEKLTSGSALRRYLCEHPALVWLLGWRVVPDEHSVYGFDVQRSVPVAGHLRAKLRTLEPGTLRALLSSTLQVAQALMPNLQQSVVLDVKHIYAPVKENNPRQYVAERYNPQRQPRGDRDCRLGVKRRTNRETATTETEYVWGYGSGIAVTPTPDGQALVLSDYTQPFNQNDVTYGLKLLNRAMTNLGQAPRQVIADAAFDAWYIYQWSAELHSLAAIALNARGHAPITLHTDDCPLCPTHHTPMLKFNEWLTDTHRQARFRCRTCATTLKLNIEPGNLLRWRLDRSADPYRALYRQRSCVERVNALAHALGIDHPRQRCLAAVARRNSLIYIVINCHVLQRFRQRQPVSKGLLNVA
jgi:hypothetical protein